MIVSQPAFGVDLSSSPKRVILDQVMAALRENDIPCCILNSYDNLSQHVPSDVDCRVSAEALPQFLVDVLHRSGLFVVQAYQRESTIYVLVVASHSASAPSFLWLDAGADFREQGCIFYHGRQVLDSATEFKGLMVPVPGLEFGHYLIKKTIQKSLNLESGSRLSALYLRDPHGCKKEIDRFWGRQRSAELASAAASGDWNSIIVRIGTFRDELIRRSRMHNASWLIEYWLPEMARRFRRLRQPGGLHVAFMGPDGSGKSSVISRVHQDLAPAFRRSASVHLAPGLVRRRHDAGPVIDPHRLGARSLAGSLCKAACWLIDYSVGYQVAIRPKLVRSTLVLFDRYYPDVLIDPKRYRYGGPMWLVRTISKVVPKPDLVILLDAPPEVLQQRKQEIPFEETARQRTAYRSLVDSLSNGHVVDASQPLDDVVASVNSVIIDFLATRTRRRLGLSVEP